MKVKTLGAAGEPQERKGREKKDRGEGRMKKKRSKDSHREKEEGEE